MNRVKNISLDNKLMVNEVLRNELIKQLALLVISGASSDELERKKLRLSEQYNIGDVVRNSDILEYIGQNYPEDYEKARLTLRTKPVRTGSGIANIAVMWTGECPGQCSYCPTVPGAPKSYTGVEPATLRAQRASFDPVAQIKNRLSQLKAIGHSTDKCELIIMGGTFLAASVEYQRSFVNSCYDALNGFASASLEDAQKVNETAENRCVGLTVETRPDYCTDSDIAHLLSYGCTRVELGVQSLYDDVLRAVNRGHAVSETIAATKRLKDAGLKVCYHIMLGLPGSTTEMDIEMFRSLFNNPDFQPDELKIYPTLVIPGTQLHQQWLVGEYKPLTTEKAARMLVEIKQLVPEYVRIKRIMRDISEKRVDAGASTTNLRQLVHYKMQDERKQCRCIRCREVWQHMKSGELPENIELLTREYEASGGRELFISYEDAGKGILVAFLRLRLIGRKAFVRELHVYGPMVSIGNAPEKEYQHRAYGRMLLQKVEDIAKSSGATELRITSGVGVRDYYRRLGYNLEEHYMIKSL